MPTVILTFAVFVIVVLLMGVGVVLTGRSLRGSCGGPDCVCESEGKPLGSCDLDGKNLPVLPS